MAKIVTAEARRELVAALSERYRAASQDQKGRIRAEFVATSGYHRKSAIRILNGDGAPATLTAVRGRRRVYDHAVRRALVILWEASDRVCGKRLRAIVPVLLPALERHGHLRLDAAVRDPFETAWPRVRSWLQVAPDATAKDLLDRLQDEQPGVFNNGQLRTLQRRAREWRKETAHALVFGVLQEGESEA